MHLLPTTFSLLPHTYIKSKITYWWEKTWIKDRIQYSLNITFFLITIEKMQYTVKTIQTTDWYETKFDPLVVYFSSENHSAVFCCFCQFCLFVCFLRPSSGVQIWLTRQQPCKLNTQHMVASWGDVSAQVWLADNLSVDMADIFFVYVSDKVINYGCVTKGLCLLSICMLQ